MTSQDTDSESRGDEGLLSRVHAFQRGDASAFDPLYAALWGPVVVRARRMGLPPDQAEEIAQKTLVRVYLYAGRGSFGHVRQLWAWVYLIATREVYKHWRKKHPEALSQDVLETLAAEGPDPSPRPPEAAEQAEAFADLKACLSGLDEAERMLLLGVLAGGLTFRQAAREHGLSLGQFKHRYEKARARLRDAMRARGHDVA